VQVVSVDVHARRVASARATVHRGEELPGLPSREGDVSAWLTGGDVEASLLWTPPARLEAAIESALDAVRKLADAEKRCERITHDPRASPTACEKARTGRTSATAALQWYLDQGLERRDGFYIYELLGRDTYFALTARGLRPPAKLNVCEKCLLVFRSSKSVAFLCSRCRNNQGPPRRPRNPDPDLRWRLDREFDATTGELVDWVVIRERPCKHCGRIFIDRRRGRGGRPRQLCRNCGDGPARKRRDRGSTSTPGARLHRFTNANGQPLSALSTHRPDGSTLHLTAADGVVETRDAEDADLIEINFPQLRRC
jgi:hypothetical protein